MALTVLAAVAGTTAPRRERAIVDRAAAARSYRTAPALLLDLAQHLTATITDQQPGTDSCTTVRRTTFNGDGGPDLTVTSVRVLHPDGSGLLLERRRSSSPTIDRGWTRTVYTAGQLLTGIPEPLPDTPHELAATITTTTAASGTTAGTQAAVIADLAGLRYLDQPHRRTVLRVLAMLPSSTILGRNRHTEHGELLLGVRFDDGTPASIDLWFTAATGRLAVIEQSDPRSGRSRLRTDLLRTARCHPTGDRRPGPPRPSDAAASARDGHSDGRQLALVQSPPAAAQQETERRSCSRYGRGTVPIRPHAEAQP